MSRIGQVFLQTLQGLSSKEEVLEIHREKHGLSREEAETIWCHYLEFIVVKAHHGDTSGKKMRFSTTPKIDALWHTHLLNTESYRELMNLAGDINPNVKFIDHFEGNANDPEAKKEERRRAASVAFEKTFGKKCQWFRDQQEDVIKEEEDNEEDKVKDGQIRIKVQLPQSPEIIALVAYPHHNIETVKRLIEMKTQIPPYHQCLTYGGCLDDDQTIAHYGIRNNEFVFLTSYNFFTPLPIPINLDPTKMSLKELQDSLNTLFDNNRPTQETQLTKFINDYLKTCKNRKPDNAFIQMAMVAFFGNRLHITKQNKKDQQNTEYHLGFGWGKAQFLKPLLTTKGRQIQSLQAVVDFVAKLEPRPSNLLLNMFVAMEGVVSTGAFLAWEKCKMAGKQEGKAVAVRETMPYLNFLKAQQKPVIEDMQILVKTLTGRSHTLRVSPNTHMRTLKAKVQEAEGVPPDQQKLISGGKALDGDYETLSSLNVENNSTVHLVLSLRGC